MNHTTTNFNQETLDLIIPVHHVLRDIIVRYDVKPLRFPVITESVFVQRRVENWNAFFAKNFPGKGYFGSDPMLDLFDQDHISFVLFSDEVFLTAFVKTLGNFDVNRLDYAPHYIEDIVLM